jgi:nucleoside phosphorylase
MIVALGSLHLEAAGILRSGDYVEVEAPEDFLAYRPSSLSGVSGDYGEFPVIVLSGSGSERASRATKWAIEEFAPDAIIAFGFCSATKDLERSGDIVIAARVVGLPGTPFEWSIVDDTDSLGPDRTLLLAARIAVEISGLDYQHGTIVTTSKFVTTIGAKKWLGEAINSNAVDTEAHSIATVANDARIPWAVVKSVLDAHDFNVPAIADRIGSGPNVRGISAYIRHVSNAPRDLPALVKLGRSSTAASAALTTFMAAFMEAHASLTNAEPVS